MSEQPNWPDEAFVDAPDEPDYPDDVDPDFTEFPYSECPAGGSHTWEGSLGMWLTCRECGASTRKESE